MYVVGWVNYFNDVYIKKEGEFDGESRKIIDMHICVWILYMWVLDEVFWRLCM